MAGLWGSWQNKIQKGHEFQRDVYNYLSKYFKVFDYKAIGHPDFKVKILGKVYNVECKSYQFGDKTIPSTTDMIIRKWYAYGDIFYYNIPVFATVSRGKLKKLKTRILHWIKTDKIYKRGERRYIHIDDVRNSGIDYIEQLDKSLFKNLKKVKQNVAHFISLKENYMKNNKT